MSCQAYQCYNYICYEVSEKYCQQHYYELNLLYQNSIIPKYEEKKCIIEDCYNIGNLVAGQWCLLHYYQKQQSLLLLKCDHDGCKRTAMIDNTITGFWCPVHLKRLKSNTETCSVEKCNKKKKLKIYNNRKYCKQHYDEQNPIVCNVSGCHRRTSLLYFNDKHWCNKHFNLYHQPKHVIKQTFVPIEKIEKNYKEILLTNIDKIIKPEKKIEMKELCHANACNKHSNLFEKHQGKWCRIHLAEISLLRKIINKHRNDYEEAIARQKEVKLRKFIDEEHIYFANKLLENVKK